MVRDPTKSLSITFAMVGSCESYLIDWSEGKMTKRISFACCVLVPLFFVMISVSTCMALIGADDAGHKKNVLAPDMEKDPGLFFLLGEESESLGDNESMLNYFKRALALDPGSAYLHMRMAAVLARNRKIADAIVMAKNAVALNPESAEAYTILGKIYTVTGDSNKAIEAYHRAVELKPDDRDLYIFLGSLQASNRMLKESEKTFNLMIQRFPDEKDGYFYLGKVYIEDEQYDKAIDIFNTLVERRGESAAQAYVELGGIYAVQKQFPKAEESYRKALSLDPFNLAARLNLAQVLAGQKKYSESYETLEELSKLAPSNLGIQIKMALLLAEQKQYDKARKLFDKILETKPGWDQVRFHLGRVLREQGKPEEAELEFNKIEKGQPSYVNSRIVLTLMFLNMKDFSKSLKYIDEAVEAEPRDPEIFHIKGSILEELYRYSEAIKEYKKGLSFAPDNVKLMYSLGNSFEKSSMRTLSLSTMEKILKEKPDDAGAMNFIGYTLAIMGKDMDRAEKLVRKALEIKPDDGYIADSLAWVLFKAGKVDEALKYLEKASRKVKNDPIIAEHLGDALVARNRLNEAKEAYQKSLSINPYNVIVQEKLRKLGPTEPDKSDR